MVLRGLKMYRPKDWDEMVAELMYFGGDRKIFEVGADAILEGLCTDENRMDCIDQYGVDPPKQVRGWLVFIPEVSDE